MSPSIYFCVWQTINEVQCVILPALFQKLFVVYITLICNENFHNALIKYLSMITP